MRKGCLLLFAAALCLAARAADVPRPLPGTYVHDFAGVISDEKKAEINAKAKQLKEQYQTEIAVVTVASLQGADSFDYSMRMARSWGIGSPDEGSRGLLILVAVKDRKTAFRTSRHTEGELPDGVTGEISREMNGYFKRGDFGGGLSVGMDRVLERMRAAFDPASAKPTVKAGGEGPGPVWVLLALLSFATVIFLPLLFIVGVAFLLWRAVRRRSAASGAAAYSHRAGGAAAAVTSSSLQGAESDTSSSSDYSSYSSSSDSSSHDSGSDSSSDSSSDYGGSSDFGGGGSDSSW